MRLNNDSESQIYQEFHSERVRAHHKHAYNGGSMESKHWEHWVWPHVLGEEMGEVNRAFCEWQLGNLSLDEFKAELREELVQVGAMASAWISAIDDAGRS